MDKDYDRAWKLLINPSRWTTGCLSRDIEGRCVTDPCNNRAVKWCVLGAIDKVYGDGNRRSHLLKLQASTGRYAVGYWNDHTPHLDVVAKLKECDI
jgi:hypothetical protein